MPTLSTEDFPYTLPYVTELLQIPETALMECAQSLSIHPRQDQRTGHTIFTYKDVELLRKAVDMRKRGEAVSTIVERLAVKEPSVDGLALATAPQSHHSLTSQPNRSTQVVGSGRDLPMVLEAVSQAKEGILKDISRLLDDKLSGLDDVVVELIRCKSENDALKKKLDQALDEKASLRHELSKFKPVKFGFYRKEG